MTLIDISPTVHPGIGVWPGDTELTREVLSDTAAGANLTLSTLHGTVHLGAHTDAWSHVDPTGASIDTMPLDHYLGPCQVIGLDPGRHGVVTPADLPDLAGAAPRLLVRTGTFPQPDQFTTDFAALSPQLVHHLADRGVVLVGIDTPSVDLFSSKELPTHHACVERGVAILEGIVLEHVAPGPYELIALPLPLVGFDASPVRAVLRR